MRLGVGSFTWPWGVGIPGHAPPRPLTAVKLLEKAAALRVRVLQICDNLPLEAMREPELDRLERLSRRLGITVEVGTRGIDPARMRRHLALAARFRSPIVRTVTDRGRSRPSPAEVVRALRPVLGAYRRAGVRIALENHDRFDSATLAWIVGKLGTRVAGVCLDTVNSFGALEGPKVVVDRLARYTVCLHVKDFVVERAGTMLGFSVRGAPAGQGRLDIPWLVRKLSSRGARPSSAVIELWTPFRGSVRKTVWLEEVWARRSVACVRRFIRG
jgi:sugar phosphate isomerase/epimerase